MLGFLCNLMREIVALIEHGQKYPFNDKPGIGMFFDSPVSLKELAEAFQSIKLAL